MIIAEVLSLAAADVLRRPVLRVGALALQQALDVGGEAAPGHLVAQCTTTIGGGDHLGVGEAVASWLKVADAGPGAIRTLVQTSTLGGH